MTAEVLKLLKLLHHKYPAKNAYIAFTKFFSRYHLIEQYVCYRNYWKKIRMFAEDILSNCVDWNKLERRVKRKPNVKKFLWSN